MCIFHFVSENVCIVIFYPDMHLMSHQNRPFSMHYKIPGRSLTQVMDAVTDVDRERIVADMALFLSELHHLPTEILPASVTESLNDFLSGLATVHRGQYDLDYHHDLVMLEQQMKKPCIATANKRYSTR